jgi:histidinol-phosphatase
VIYPSDLSYLGSIDRDLSMILTTGLEAIALAKTLTMASFGERAENDLPFSQKPDSSPVTDIDRSVEALVRSMILDTYPDHQILGEETGLGGRSDSEYTWVLDPIDGTKNFIRGIPYFATQLAVLKGDRPIVAISSAPAMDELLVARLDGGAYLNGRRIHVSTRTCVADAYIAHGGVKHFRCEKLAQLQRVCDQSWNSRGYGDFLGYHLVATGTVDAMIEANAKLWDIAAVTLIVKEAGGTVTDLGGAPLHSEMQTSVVASNGRIHDELIRFFGQGDVP